MGKSKNRKMKSGVKNHEDRNFGKRKIRNRDRDRKSGNRFLVKQMKLKIDRKLLTRKIIFKKTTRRDTSQGILFSKLT